ncbi:hypothetical protein CEF21_21250 [Bacillus sp. FJAT-42376]|uniref:hypothetical protein n=1 Tax=Bacillus sp. FJAT-42376 TaxID=2014076 RepID=UPI000F4E51C0|nr:hypothetical protein [Bacillus sp. FJAT-42376]AZB44609.1 hypothetical protein CEF21_21250 [Bacillus sp. FJAT-42376]
MFNFDRSSYISYLKLVRNVSILGIIVFFGYYLTLQLQAGTAQIGYIYAGFASAIGTAITSYSIIKMKRNAAGSR